MRIVGRVLQEFGRGSAAYNIPEALRLRRELDRGVPGDVTGGHDIALVMLAALSGPR